MGVPNSEVGYTSAMPRREDHEVHKDMWGHWVGGEILFSLSGLLRMINPLNAELNPISQLLALLGAHHIFHVSGLRVKWQYQ